MIPSPSDDIEDASAAEFLSDFHNLAFVIPVAFAEASVYLMRFKHVHYHFAENLFFFVEVCHGASDRPAKTLQWRFVGNPYQVHRDEFASGHGEPLLKKWCLADMVDEGFKNYVHPGHHACGISDVAVLMLLQFAFEIPDDAVLKKIFPVAGWNFGTGDSVGYHRQYPLGYAGIVVGRHQFIQT